MNKSEFRQWFIEHFNVGNNCSVGPGLLDAILDYAEKLGMNDQRKFLKEMFANIDLTEEEIAQAQFCNGNTDVEGVCPICGGKIEYTGTHTIDDDGGMFDWNCPDCGASGREGYNRAFDRHYWVADKDGKSVSDRPE